MRLEDIKREFPQTPDYIRQMIEDKVEEQLHAEQIAPFERKVNRFRMSFQKAIAVGFAAVMLMGTTVYAGVKLYQIYMEKNGTYGVQTTMEQGNTEEGGVSVDKVPEIEIKAGYLPDGMIQTGNAEKVRIEDADAPGEGGISMFDVLLDVEQEKVTANDTYVISSEMISFDGHEGVYIEKQTSKYKKVTSTFDKKIYLMYPEVQRVLIMNIADNVTKEEALKVAEQIELVDTGKKIDAQKLYSWTDYAVGDKEEVQGENVFANKAVSSQMKNLHGIGESFLVPSYCQSAAGEYIFCENVEVKVISVEVSDDLALLENEYIPEEWKTAVGSDGKLIQNELTYFKRGNGVHTLDEEVKTETTGQRLVYVTLEYKNIGDEALNDILFFGTLNAIHKDADIYEMIYYEDYYGTEEWNYRSGSSVARIGEMAYYDVKSKENKNYISSLAAGESCTVHMAWIVNETDLDELYLNMNPSGGSEFDKESLEIGFVDIRQ